MDLSTVLNQKVLTALVTKFPAGNLLGVNLCPLADNVPGVTAEWDELLNGRGLAEFNAFGNPGKTEAAMNVNHRVASMAVVRQKRMLKGMQLYHLRAPGGDWASQWGEQRIAAELLDLTNEVKRTWEWAFWQMLKGTLTVAQADVKFAVSYGIAGAHLPTTTIAWSTIATADPIQDLMDWKKLIAQDAGEDATDLYVSSTVMGYLIQNAKVRELMRNQYGRQMAEEGRIVKLCGMNVHEYSAGYVPTGGSFTQYIDDGHVVLISKGNPDPMGKITNNMADIQQGSPEDQEAGGKPGLFAKSWTEEDPAGVQALVASTFLPVLKKPENVVYADIIP